MPATLTKPEGQTAPALVQIPGELWRKFTAWAAVTGYTLTERNDDLDGLATYDMQPCLEAGMHR